MEKESNSRTLNAFAREAAAADMAGGYRLPKEIQKRRLQLVIQTKLTDKQRLYLGCCLAGDSMTDVAEKYGVSRSTVCRTVHRAIRRARDYLQF